jgi:DNA-binding MarR family transcriptional regulator
MAGMNTEAGGSSFSDRMSLIEQISETWSPEQMRAFSSQLLKLADSIDQAWNRDNLAAVYHWPDELSRIEKDAANLAAKAQMIYLQRERRRKFLPADILGEPAWDMLLDLFMQFAGQAKVSTSSLCIASQVPTSTALRHIANLEADELVTRQESDDDKRVNFVELSDRGVLAMGRYLQQY